MVSDITDGGLLSGDPSGGESHGDRVATKNRRGYLRVNGDVQPLFID